MHEKLKALLLVRPIKQSILQVLAPTSARRLLTYDNTIVSTDIASDIESDFIAIPPCKRAKLTQPAMPEFRGFDDTESSITCSSSKGTARSLK